MLKKFSFPIIFFFVGFTAGNLVQQWLHPPQHTEITNRLDKVKGNDGAVILHQGGSISTNSDTVVEKRKKKLFDFLRRSK